MYYIYKYENKINHKCYIGQTSNIQKRKNSHRSNANNIKSSNYGDAFHAALRKYGEENFDFDIIEEIDEAFGRDYLNEREKFFIKYFHSHVSENGYNITWGGDGHNVEPLTFEECCKQSRIFNEQEVRDIQQMLISGYQYFEIKKKYNKLTDSFLTNINTGLNFKRKDLSYPLNTIHSKFSKETMDNIKTDIKNNISYNQIHKKYGISISFISQINNGHRWFDKNEFYPLCNKLCNDREWGMKCIYDILFTSLTYEQIAKKYQRSHSAVKAIASGRNFHNDKLKYSLRKYKKENQEIFRTILDKCCIDYPQLDVE